MLDPLNAHIVSPSPTSADDGNPHRPAPHPLRLESMRTRLNDGRLATIAVTHMCVEIAMGRDCEEIGTLSRFEPVTAQPIVDLDHLVYETWDTFEYQASGRR